MDINFGILGRTALRIGGQLDESWGSPRIRAMLAALLVHAGRSVPMETLVAWVWAAEKAAPDDPVATLHTNATRLRRWFERMAQPPALHASYSGCRLDVDRDLIDYHQFRLGITQARDHARKGDPRQAIACAERAIGLWRGQPLDELTSAPAQAWRTRVLQDEWIPANVVLLDGLVAVGELDEALIRLDDLLGEHGTNLALTKLRLSVLHRLGRAAEATAFYFSTRRQLRADADDAGAEHLRLFHDALREPDTAGGPEVKPRQLHHDLPDFVGRADLLDELDAATAGSAGVVLIDGMAGVGKTALALRWAHRARHRFPDGDFFVNLNGFSDGPIVSQAAVIDDFLIALGRPPNKDQTRRTRELLLGQLLSGRRTLVVLDNVRSTKHVRDLIALLGDSLVIVTSRQRLTGLSALTGARRVRVEPMTVAEAGRLLAARLGTRRRVDEAERARLVRLCGGLPLVITVLAEHIATRPAAELSSFADQFAPRQLITGIGADGDRPATPATFFSWSYRALDPPEQRLFRLLSAHPGPDFSIETAAACAGRSVPETTRGLNALVGAHLLEQPDTFNRYRYHDLIREFARYRAELDEPAPDRDAAELRMLGHYLTAATAAYRILYPGRLTAPDLAGEPAVFTDPGSAKTWFDRERTNLAAAIARAAERGHHDHAWQLTDPVASLNDRYGYYEDSRAVRELAVASARAAGHRAGEGSSLVGLGMVQMILGDHNEAAHSLELALRIVEGDGDQRGQGSVLHQLARLAMLRGDPTAGVALYRRCLEVNERIADQEGLSWTHFRIGEALRMLEHSDEAVVHLHQALTYAQRSGDPHVRAHCLTELGILCRDRGDHPAATAHCDQALAIVAKMPIPDLAVMTKIRITLAEICNATGAAEAAVEHVSCAIDLARTTHNATAEAHALEVCGDIQFANGEPHQAADTWRKAAALYARTGNVAHAATIHQKISDVPPGPAALPRSRTESAKVTPRLQK